jgi:hypothetical protein
MRFLGRLFASIGVITFAAGLNNLVCGQDSAKIFTATLVGRVVDTSGTAVADAEVVVTRAGDSAVVGTGTSNKRGNVTLKRLPAGGSYAVTARKIGYGAARGTVQFQAGDTLYVDFELPPLAVVLAPITVTGRRNRLSIAADQFNPKHYRDALSLLVDRRRDMLGDPDRCPLPDSLLGGPGYDSTLRINVNSRLSILGTDSKGDSILRVLRRRLWLDSVRYYSAMAVPNLPFVQRVYVNGVRVDWPKVRIGDKLQPVPGRTVVEELQRIPADQIAEIRYADCWDQSVPFYMQYALYVTLKPPSRAVQDSILRSITKRDSAPR